MYIGQGMEIVGQYIGQGVEIVGQFQHEAMVVIVHAKEALKAGLVGGNEEVIAAWTQDLRDMMAEG